MIDLLQRILYGNTEYLKHSDLARLTKRHPFSAFLNYLAYDPKREIYVNQDSTFGMMWECSPLTYAGEKAITTLEGIFRAGVPHGTIIQFALQADSHIEPIIDLYRHSRSRTDAIITTNTERVTEFLLDGKKGLEACSNIPVRNFRLFVAVKVPGDAPDMPRPEELDDNKKVAPLLDIKRQINETLRAANLYPRGFTPSNLLEWLRRLLNSYPKDYPEHNFSYYSPDIPILKQIINADTVIKEGSDYIQAGDKYWCCTTPKSFPREVDPMQTNSLFGGIWGIISDADQIKTDFLYSFNIVFQKGIDVSIHAKTNLMLNQKAVGSLSTMLHRKQVEHMDAADDLEHGVKFLKIIPVFWVFSDDVEKSRDSCTRVRRLWENNGYVMQRDNMVLKILFISSFPLCLYADGKNIENLERDFTAPVPSITPLLPVQGDFVGSGGIPNLIFTGRKGQLVSLDFFAKGANNFNAVCCATSGSGKSFLVNFIAFNYYACGSIIRIIDIGGSYKKMADMLGARYLDFSPDTKICLNPFTNIDDPENELLAIVPLIMQMAYLDDSDTKDRKSIEKHVVRDAIEWAFADKGNEADIDDVYHYLAKIPDLPNTVPEKVDANHVESARKLASLIYDFTSKGSYGKFFCGRSTFDIRHDEFVVLELENLKVQPALYKVVTLLVIDAVTKDLYLSDRSRHRLIIFDEAWQFINEESTQISQVIDEGYRRARKYSGSFMVITQSILDMGKDKFGKVGTGIIGNAAYKIFLESGDFDKAKQEKLIDYDDFSMKLLKSIKSNPPYYSEIFFDTPFGVGPARLIVNDYAYFLYTSKATEIAMIEAKVKSGKTYHEAILEMVELRKNGEL
jgi:conjugal transfer ATP-binding protein TraC